jgi:hypothetical protein
MPIAYDPSRTALFQPERADTVFRDGPPPGDEALAAEAARLAYVRVEEGPAETARLAAALALAGFGEPVPFEHPGSDGQGYGTLRADGLALLAFRGTQPDRVGDLASDAGFLHTAWDHGPGRVHSGFRNTATGLWPAVQRWLDGPASGRRQLLVCGHSLGAAIATLLAVPAGATRLVTIGSPRVGDADFVAGLESATLLTVTRIVDCCDVVTEVPPAAIGFEHAGSLVYVDRDGRVSADTSRAFIDDDRAHARQDYLARHAFRFGTVLARELADHAPVNYLRAFWP